VRESRIPPKSFGELKSLHHELWDLWLAPYLPALYENIRPEYRFDAGERVLDLPMRRPALAIRMKEPSQSGSGAQADDSAHAAHASRAYLDKGGFDEIEEIGRHQLIVKTPARFRLRQTGRLSSICSAMTNPIFCT
jgi:hypothetical protein